MTVHLTETGPGKAMERQPIDPYTVKHLDAWLDEQISGDTRRDAVRSIMLDFIADDQEYWGAQSWWLVYDRAGCDAFFRDDAARYGAKRLKINRVER